MNFWQRSRKIIAAIVLCLTLTITTACSSAPVAQDVNQLPAANGQVYSQLERGNSATGQKFGDWVVQTGNGLISDAYVRDNNKLGVVINRQVQPNEVRPLAKSLIQGFHRNFPNQDLTVLMYAPDKKLILTAQYDEQSRQVQYQ
ncbi:hypothetical protein Sta7437_3197 [Stanieria cyanosphaera PCC 7437]|uniref:Lipoprotein n=1 Tax=Stanieria cyanosphaera (strain ATCC 29371 / PCC 7437) TaxID=111780 RepID=K9XXB9_STAC7|nr:hypothetical protein [Stanieria cyanosphaera]AFZ36704.1 hypothetical protein Sta7437_3197 [Stanieria cyanosphaera PCC 7437]